MLTQITAIDNLQAGAGNIKGPPLTTFVNNEAVCCVCVVVQSGKKRLMGSFSV